MNNIIRIDYDTEELNGLFPFTTVNITLQTDGEPSDPYWVWEVSVADLKRYFNDERIAEDIDNHELSEEDAERFVNDESILEDSDYYECGKEPIYGCWYAPLTMEQIEQIFGL